MLDLNENDNQGVRFELLPCYLAESRLEEARELMDRGRAIHACGEPDFDLMVGCVRCRATPNAAVQSPAQAPLPSRVPGLR